MNSLAKCKCQHCDQNIEFEMAEEGRSVNCPGCGLETLLFIIRKSQPRPSPPPATPAKTKSQRIHEIADKFSEAAIFQLWIAGIACFITLLVFAYADSGEERANALIIGGGIVSAILGISAWCYLIAQIVHIRANTEKA